MASAAPTSVLTGWPAAWVTSSSSRRDLPIPASPSMSSTPPWPSRTPQPLGEQAALVGPTDQRSAGCPGGAQAMGTEDGDRLGDALHPPGRQWLEVSLALAAWWVARSQTTSSRAVCMRRAPRFDPTDHGVLAPQVAPDRAAERPPGGDPDGVADPVPAQLRLDAKGGANRADAVVFVGDRRQAEGCHHGGALVVHPELVHRTLVLVQGLLHLADQIVGRAQRARA